MTKVWIEMADGTLHEGWLNLRGTDPKVSVQIHGSKFEFEVPWTEANRIQSGESHTISAPPVAS